jgi:uncharacterized damage-inducible protein DinB
MVGMATNKYPDMWVDPEDDPREGGTSLGDEKETLAEYLRVQRLTLEMKCAGLGPADFARRSVEPSTMSLLGLIRHMADVERTWFRQRLAGQDVQRHYRTLGDRDADFNGAVGDPVVVEEAWRLWRDACAFADQYIEQATDLGQVYDDPRGGQFSLREVLVHMVEEYARHNGHADLIRERIDGRTGQ